MWLVETFDDFSQYLPMFEGAETIGNYDGLIFKKKTGPLSLCLGLFDGDRLVAYYWFVKFASQHKMWHGFELAVDEAYRRRGIALFFYLHVLHSDKTTMIVSDYSHSPQSAKIWDKMQTIPQLQVGMYNHLSDTIDWSHVDKNLVYNNHHMHFVVRAI